MRITSMPTGTAKEDEGRMRRTLIACKTVEDELEAALGKTGVEIPVKWVESGLHNVPEKLHARLQSEIDALDEGVDQVLMCFGSCGTSLVGLEARCHELVIPRVDDCISLLIGSDERRASISRDYAAYYLTEGWMRGERNLWVEHLYAVEKYGEEGARRIDEMMYGNYRTLALLDAGVYPIDHLTDETRIIADTLELEQRTIPASIAYIEDLLRGPYDDGRFVIVEAGDAVRADAFMNQQGRSPQQ